MLYNLSSPVESRSARGDTPRTPAYPSVRIASTMPVKDIPSTLPELLRTRAAEQSSAGFVSFLDAHGAVEKSVSYRELYLDAVVNAQKLLAAGLIAGTDIVITSFPDHESHLRVFWACALAGIVVCPLPALHPDPSRQVLFFKHLQTLLKGPTLIAKESTIAEIHTLAPDVKALSLAHLEKLSPSPSAQRLVFPDRQVSPDEIVVLMLTSGSTGNSKAVALRHSNLLSSIRGKVKHHRSSPNSRFLNWIAFDHVACVSEVHLHALEVNGSQYHASSTAVLPQARNLLEWCSRYRITYTFSPNFLVAQICREVALAPFDSKTLDLSRLDAFISGGEAVPIKTAVDFADLIESFGARRDVLRAGFGMSETGAGSIYDTRAIVRDAGSTSDRYLSLGRCCTGTRVRITSRQTGEPCAPFEPGQLELAGPTVFREYYNNEKANAESFTADGWFITGDSGLLDHDGNLSLVGRDKDHLNINGVKYPSVDAENFIEDSAIEGTTRAFVYVCAMRLPDRDTDSYGVFYQHSSIRVEDGLSDEDVKAIAQANSKIRHACIIFCSQAPHVVLPLPRKAFSKTALGKVSRSGLATAYLQGQYADLEATLRSVPAEVGAPYTPANPIEEQVFGTVAEMLDFDITKLTRMSSIFDIGVTSMHLIRLKHLLQERLAIVDIPTIDMLRYPELGQLSDHLAKLASAAATPGATGNAAYSPLVCMNPHGSKPPVFLVHPGVGEVLVFVNLARALNDDRPVYALRARGFGAGETVFESFDEMVASYADAILGQWPAGPYFVAGYSFGGAVAFEIGKRLEAQRRAVAWLGVFNLPPHIQFRMVELTWLEVLINLLMFLALIPAPAFEQRKAALHAAFPAARTLDGEPANALEILDWALAHGDQARLAELQIRADELRAWTQVAYAMSCLGRSYTPGGLVRKAHMTVFCAIPLPSMGTREEFKRDRLAGWSEFRTGGVEFVDVDGEHYTMLSEEHVVSFAGRMVAAMSRASAAL
nr:polyporic acid synthetase CorA [Terana caerulea]